jgi:hypothetical protein
VTETYTEYQYSYNFGSAEVGYPLVGNELYQCSQGICSVVTGDPQLTSRSLLNGMQAVEENGDVVLPVMPDRTRTHRASTSSTSPSKATPTTARFRSRHRLPSPRTTVRQPSTTNTG